MAVTDDDDQGGGGLSYDDDSVEVTGGGGGIPRKGYLKTRQIIDLVSQKISNINIK